MDGPVLTCRRTRFTISFRLRLTTHSYRIDILQCHHDIFFESLSSLMKEWGY